MHRKTLILYLFLCVLVAGAFAMGRTPPEKPKAASSAIDFTLNDLNGKPHTLSDYRGKIVFLNFWATWCPPCRAEMPSMQRLYMSWDQRQYVMLAVNIKESRSKVEAFARENGYTFPILLDEEGRIAGKYKVMGIPTTFFVGRDGEIITKGVGAREWTQEEIKRLIK